MMTRPRIAVIGSANVDLVTFTDNFPKPGETIFGKKFDMGFGGKGANQAVAARLCGAHVDMVARVGDDLFGPATVKNLESYGIDVTHVRVVKGVSSGVAPIFVDSEGQNRILVVKGANESLLPADVDLALPILKKSDCIILQFEIPLETVYHTIDFAKSNGIRCVLNPAPADSIDIKVLRHVDYFIPNESEAETISGMPLKTVADAERCAGYFLEQGLRNVIITLGSKGAFYATSGAMQLIPGYPVETMDSTGAGDAFIGSFAAFLSEGAAPSKAVQRACLYAALSTLKIGTQKSFLERDEFEKHDHD
jgi:ribokinase